MSFAMANQHEAGTMRPVHAPACPQDVLDQPLINASPHRPPTAHPVEVATRNQQGAPGQGPRPIVFAVSAELVNGLVRRGQIDELEPLAHHLRLRVFVREHEVPDVVGTVEIVVVHLGQQGPARRRGGDVEHRAERFMRGDPHYLRRVRKRGDSPLDILEPLAVQCQH